MPISFYKTYYILTKTYLPLQLNILGLAVLLGALVLIIRRMLRSRQPTLPLIAIWLTVFMLNCGLIIITLVAITIVIVGIFNLGTGLGNSIFLLFPTVPNLLVLGLCTFFLWRCRPREGITPARIAGVLLLLTCVTGFWLEIVHTKTVTFEILDSDDRHVEGASIEIDRTTWVLGGIVPSRHYKIVTDKSGLASFQTWDFNTLETKVTSPAGAVAIEIKQNETIKNQFDITHTWHTTPINAHSDVISFTPIKYPLHIRCYLMPDGEFRTNPILEAGYTDLLFNPDQIILQTRNLPFSLLLLRDEAALEKVQLGNCPEFGAPCTLSEYYAHQMVTTYSDLQKSLWGLRNKIAAQELGKLLAQVRPADDISRNFDNMPNKQAYKLIINLVRSIDYYSLKSIYDELRKNGAEASPEELQLMSLGESLVGLEHLEIPWQEAAMRLILLVDSKLATWMEKTMIMDERHRR